jgi:hypothetical protein
VKSPSGRPWPAAVTGGALRFVAYLAVHDPRLLWDYVRWALRGDRRATHEPPLSASASPISPTQARAFIIERVGAHADGAAVETVRREAPRSKAISANLVSMAGDMSLGELLYALIRGLRPEVVIETGVAHGITSAYILAGLSDNGIGELHSIDLPTRAMIRSGLVGAAVPDELRGRWTYHWAPSSRELPSLLEKFGSRLGLFIHDSDHSYANMRWELERAWEAVPAGAWLAADDAQLHSAFEDVTREFGVDAIFVSQDAKQGWTGLTSKSALASSAAHDHRASR